MMTGQDASIQAGSDTSIREQVTIMVVTTAIEFACGFWLIALAVLSSIDLLDGSIDLAHLVAFPLSFGLTLLTGYKAMLLICRPERRGFLLVLALALATVAPMIVAGF